MSQHDTLRPPSESMHSMPRLPSSLLDLIGDYGMARTECSVGGPEFIERYQALIKGIKDYAAAQVEALATPAQDQKPPYAWAVSGASTMFFGPTAEYDARQEAKHCGGTAEAFPLFRYDQAQQAGEPYAYAVYFPDQPTEMLVHDLDELIDDMTNREHTVTKLYDTTPPAPAQPSPPPAQPVQGVPEGWKLVPVEPTQEMLASVSWPVCAKTDWHHMLTAAPTPQAQPAQQGEPT